MNVFGLVHGPWHGAWCRAGVARELEALGHTPAARSPAWRSRSYWADGEAAIAAP